MSSNALKNLQSRLIENRNSLPVGIYSVCSSHPAVISASIEQAKADHSLLLIESTSNQVNQFGGYTGLTPEDFVTMVKKVAVTIGYPEENLIFGGDHLGPNPWQHLSVANAMTHSKELIRTYVQSGYKKIHLDASMHCADDLKEIHKPLPDEIVAERAAELCRISEDTWHQQKNNSQPPVYIIGTEVPIPGGAKVHEDSINPTHPNDAIKTIEITKQVFLKNNLEDAWNRVIGVVVQPGVEFGDDTIFHYRRESAASLSNALYSIESDTLVYEAHSTDYQTELDLRNLVEDHFAILKVGPYLTFAYREAVFSLEKIEKELFGTSKIELSHLQDVIEEEMLHDSRYWKNYYQGSEAELQQKRKYSFSDRIRYYWPNQRISDSINTLHQNINSRKIPISLLSQFMPKHFEAIQNGLINPNFEELVSFSIRDVLRIYARACGYPGRF